MQKRTYPQARILAILVCLMMLVPCASGAFASQQAGYIQSASLGYRLRLTSNDPGRFFALLNSASTTTFMLDKAQAVYDTSGKSVSWEIPEFDGNYYLNSQSVRAGALYLQYAAGSYDDMKILVVEAEGNVYPIDIHGIPVGTTQWVWPERGNSRDNIYCMMNASYMRTALYAWPPVSDATFAYLYACDQSGFAFDVTVSDPSLGGVEAVAGAGEEVYLLATLASKGYSVERWEVALGRGDGTGTFRAIEGSEGKTILPVSAEGNLTYRVVLQEDAYRTLSFSSNKPGEFASAFASMALSDTLDYLAYNPAQTDYRLYEKLNYEISLGIPAGKAGAIGNIRVSCGAASATINVGSLTASFKSFTLGSLTVYAGINSGEIWLWTSEFNPTEDLSLVFLYPVAQSHTLSAV